MRKAPVAFAALFCAFIAPSVLGAQTPPPTLGVPNTNPVAPRTSPIQVEACTTPEIGGLLIARTTAAFKITFTNEGSVTADLVRFEIQLGEEDVFIRDVGKFEPGVTITHTFRRRGGNVVTSPLLGPAKFGCGVASAHFIDGSVWTQPDPSAPQPVPETPTPLAGDGYVGIQLAETDAGLVVHLLVPNGPADKAGLQQGDLIFKIDRQRVSSIADAITLISATRPGTTLPITVIRDGTQQTFTLVVETRPPGASAP